MIKSPLDFKMYPRGVSFKNKKACADCRSQDIVVFPSGRYKCLCCNKTTASIKEISEVITALELETYKNG